MSSFRRLSYKAYLSDDSVAVPRETKRRRQLNVDREQHRQHENQEECVSEFDETVGYLLQDDDDSAAAEEDYGSANLEPDTGDVPDGDSPVYTGSSLTKGQLFTLVFAFALRHCCTEVAISDMITILNALVPGCLPHNVYFFKKLLQPGISEQIEMHAVCSECSSYLSKVTANVKTIICSSCNASNTMTNLIKWGYTFLVYPLEQQLVNLFEKVNVGVNISPKSTSGSINDIQDGSEYRKLQIHFPESISLTGNTDGVPVFNSSKVSLWPLYFVINELPVALRRVHMLLAALWLGPSKPSMESFLKPIVHALEFLGKTGFSWFCNGTKITTKVYMCLVSCDSVARPLLLNIKQFNGEYGCNFCLAPGTTVCKGAGYIRSYAGSHHGSTPERTHEQLLQHAQLAVNSGNTCFGVKGPSILALLPRFDLVCGFSAEYMHCVLLGVVRQFVFLWLDSSSSGKPYYLGLKISRLDEILTSIKPPSNIKRLPRSITLRKYWKASEWRNFLLFYSPMMLKSLLPNEFFRHWCLLVYSIHHLMMTPIIPDTLAHAELALYKFSVLVEELYGREFVTFNVHLLTHLATTVERWGPLWSNSAFSFEDANGKLLSYFHGSRGVANQIYRSFIAASHLRVLAQRYVKDVSASLLDEIVTLTPFCAKAVRVGVNVVCLGASTVRCLNADELIAISQALNFNTMKCTDISEYKRLLISGNVLHTISYSAGLRVQDCYFCCESRLFCLVSCVVVRLCKRYDCDCHVHEEPQAVLLLAHPINGTPVQNWDGDIGVNLTVHMKKAVVDDCLVAVEASHFSHKLCMVSASLAGNFLFSMPVFELD